MNPEYPLDAIFKKLFKIREDVFALLQKRSSPLDTLCFFHWLIKMNNVQDAIEIGTFRGLSACFMATAIKGTLFTINISKEEEKDAKELAKYLGVKNIRFILGDSLEALDILLPGVPALDFVYIDGNHSYEYAAGEYYKVEPFLKQRPAAAAVFDDAEYVHPDGKEDGGVPRIVSELGIGHLPGNLRSCAIKPFNAWRTGLI